MCEMAACCSGALAPWSLPTFNAKLFDGCDDGVTSSLQFRIAMDESASHDEHTKCENVLSGELKWTTMKGFALLLSDYCVAAYSIFMPT